MKNSLIELIEGRPGQARVRLRAPLLAGTSVQLVPGGPAAGGLSEAGVPQPRFDRAGLSAMDPGMGGPIDVVPQESDYVYPVFRALSQALIEGYCLDFSTPGVLEASMPMLAGQTVYLDHHFWNVEKWVGVINSVSWDAEGAHSDGIPGINTELKIDAYLNPRIARGLMMTPPAIHSASVTVLFQFEASHMDLMEQGRFWDLLGEEVDGEIVRLIVTQIDGYWELSLVFQGADRRAKQQPDEGETEDPETLNAAPVETPAPATTTEVKTVKLTEEQKQSLGLTAEGDEVPDEQVLQAIGPLAARAAAGDVLLAARREECLRQATLATLGSGEGTLNEALVTMINSAPAEQVEGLIKLYAEQAAAKLGTGRSSQESTEGQPGTEAQKPVQDTSLL